MSTTAPAAAQLVSANHFQLAGHRLHVTYAPFVEAGQPLFSYQDAHQCLTFRGSDIQSTATAAGTVVSVVLRRTIDAGYTTFSIFVPRVQVALNGSAPCATEGITAVHTESIAPALLRGQLDHYSVASLHGTASHVLF